MPLVRRTRATLRSAEFGFSGVVVYTRVQTPRRCGQRLQCRALRLLGCDFAALADQLRNRRHSRSLCGVHGPSGEATAAPSFGSRPEHESEPRKIPTMPRAVKRLRAFTVSGPRVWSVSIFVSGIPRGSSRPRRSPSKQRRTRERPVGRAWRRPTMFDADALRVGDSPGDHLRRYAEGKGQPRRPDVPSQTMLGPRMPVASGGGAICRIVWTKLQWESDCLRANNAMGGSSREARCEQPCTLEQRETEMACRARDPASSLRLRAPHYAGRVGFRTASAAGHEKNGRPGGRVVMNGSTSSHGVSALPQSAQWRLRSFPDRGYPALPRLHFVLRHAVDDGSTIFRCTRAGRISRPTMTFSLSPWRLSTLPETAASVRTRVVSWKEAAEMKLSVAREAFGDSEQQRTRRRRLATASMTGSFSPSKDRVGVCCSRRKSVSPGSTTFTEAHHLSHDDLDVLVVDGDAL